MPLHHGIRCTTCAHMRLWCSSSTAPSHGVDPGAIPGRRTHFAAAVILWLKCRLGLKANSPWADVLGCSKAYACTKTKQKLNRANRGSNPGHLAAPWCRKRALYPLSYTRNKLRHPGVEPGSARPQRAVLTTKLMPRY